jgi:hypothetical protein
VTPDSFADLLRQFTLNGEATVEAVEAGLRYFVNEYWTAAQRQAHSLHEVSYRACFKPQLPAFFIARLTEPGQRVYDPFSGRGTTALEAALLGRAPAANDVNPLSAMLSGPRMAPPRIEAVAERLDSIVLSDALSVVRSDALSVMPGLGPAIHPMAGVQREDAQMEAVSAPLHHRHSADGRTKSGHDGEDGSDATADRVSSAHIPDSDLLAFYHPDTLHRIKALRRYLLGRDLDPVDAWIRMVALNRLTGHSPGFFSVYTMPPNQAVSAVSQRKINAARGQTPPARDVKRLILKKSMRLLADGPPPPHPSAGLMTGSAGRTPALADGSVDLIVTSPPFLDTVDYQGDNWLRCWFAGIDPAAVKIDAHRDIPSWEGFVRRVFTEFARIVRPGGFVAFEVGEVRGGKVLLERNVAAAIQGLPFDVLGVMVNRQDFTKTANCWGVGNNRRGTNTNRIVLAVRR